MTSRRAPQGLFTASARVFDLSLGEMLWSRRTVFMSLVTGVPVIMAIAVRAVDLLGGHIRMGNVSANGPSIFGMMIWFFFVRFTVPVLAVFYGTALIADEVEDKTITYLFTRPIPRGAVLLGKFLAYLACTISVLLPSVVIVWLLIIPMGGSLGANFIDLVKDLAIVAIGLCAYGAVFACIGSALKRPVLIGVFLIFGWEPAVLAFPGYLKRLSVGYYVQGLVPHAMPNDSMLSLLQGLVRETPTLAESLFAIALIVLIALAIGIRNVTVREYVLEQ
jgi:ABC-type transport system involved in multi-copper enzyme maturation permease subunit